ncbi:MAG: right-handed parallel beta-helix repeat-containing protein [Saprospiraceae bacterium]
MNSKAYTNALAVCLALLLGTTFSLRAQSLYQVDPFAAAASPFTALDSTELTTGLLAERGGPFFSLYNYSLNLPHHDSLVLDVSGLQMAGVTAWSMAYDSTDVAWMGDRRYKDRQRAVSDTLFLGGLLVQYDQFDGDALANNLVTLDTVAGKVYDVPNRPQSPYVLDTAALMTILTQQAAGQDVVFYLDSRDMLSNVSGLTVSGLRINGQKLEFGIDTALHYTFPSTGSFAISLELSDGNTVYSAHGSVVVPPPARLMSQMMMGDSLIVPIDGGGGDIRIYYSGNCGSTLSKTIIFVGGIDPENSRGYYDVTLPKILYEVENTSNTSYNGRRVVDLLEENDFDIIFVDWADGAASLGTNARTVANAIQTINRLKAEDGDYSNSVIVGQSMAGLCVRAGIHVLDSMEVDPQLEMFFSWDAPHRGANYPASLQSMLVYYGQSKNLRKWVDKLDRAWEAHHSAASQQLKLFHIGEQGELSTAAFDAWQTYYQSFDISVPHYAMSNGSGTNNQLSSTPAASRVVLPGSFILRADKVTQTTLVSKTVFIVQAEYLPGNFEISFETYLFGKRTIDIDLAHSRDVSQGLPNYDILPASISNVGIGEAAATAPSGEVIEPWWLNLLTPRTSFNVLIPGLYYAYVPTQSAQNLPLSFTPSQGTAGFDTDAGVVSVGESLPTPGSFQGPTSSHNHDHVVFTPQLVVFFLDRVLGAELPNLAPQGQNNFIDEQYNFGVAPEGRSTPTRIGGQITVTPVGQLTVTHDDRIFNSSDQANPFNVATDFQLILSDGNCNVPLADITLQSGAQFTIGENSTRKATLTALPGTRVSVQGGGVFEVNSGSQAFFESDGPDGVGGLVVESGGLIHAKFGGDIIADGGTIRIRPGGQLRTSYASRIIARNGGKIILEDGALVQLWSGVDKEGDGTVWIQNGGELVIEGEYNFTGSGYWQFDNGNTVSGEGDLIIEGDGKEFRRMKVNTSAEVLLDDGQDFRVQNARVEYRDGGSVSVLDGSTFDIYNVRFSGPAGKAIYTDGSVRSSIDNSEFLNNRRGIVFHSDGPLSAVEINTSLFQSATEAGISFEVSSSDRFGRTPKVNGCTFSGCAKGVNIDAFIAVNISNSSFTSSDAFQYAVYAQDCESLLMYECTVSGYETKLTSNSKEGAVELEIVTARFSGGQYTANTVAIHDKLGSTLTFDDCVEVSANCIGIANSESGLTGDFTTLALDGMSLINNSIGIHGGSGTITSGGINTFQMPAVSNSSSCIYADAPNLIAMDSRGMDAPSITLNGNHWLTPQGATLTAAPDPYVWFCINTGGNHYCEQTSIPTNNFQLQGCGSGPCEDPESCDYYCELNPESPYCWGGGGVGLPGFTVTPNPTGGVVALSQLPENGGTLNVFDARGALMKVI